MAKKYNVRASRFDGLSDTIEYYEHLIKDRNHSLSKTQRKQLEEAGRTISVFGEAGDNYYKLSKQLIKESDKMAKTASLRSNVTNVAKTASKGNLGG